MKVYIVTAGHDYEGEDIKFVSSNVASAEHYQKRLLGEKVYDNVEIEVFTVDHDYWGGPNGEFTNDETK